MSKNMVIQFIRPKRGPIDPTDESLRLKTGNIVLCTHVE